MQIIIQILKLFSFLSSILGTILIISITYFFENTLFYQLIIGLFLVMITILLTRTSISNIRRFKRTARRQGFRRDERKKLSKSIKNRFFTGHVARAFMIGTILFNYERLLIFPIMIYCSIAILAMMKTRQATLPKIIISTLLGTITGIAGIILSNFIF